MTMPDLASFTVQRVEWHARRADLHLVRRAVFIEEQGVSESLEWDDEDERSRHVLATDADGIPIGTGRLRRDCQIGRMAVVREWRGRGVGSTILKTLLEIARNDACDSVRLHAQTHAISFYARCGFIAVGPEFMEAGIPHRMMELPLASAP
ncbi:MAG TPA: GNAT family N-acetyltransferase [Burkholderiales bacterium]|nr:GNAT family N-acetyltransferase [Burkholderiales bacterium]